MAEARSIVARLRAEDDMSSVFRKATNAVGKLKSEITSGFAFGILTGAGQAAFNTIKNSVTGLISEIDSSNASWKTFTKNMQMLGKSDKEIAGVKKELQDFAQKTIYSSSDMATTFAQLEAVGVKNTTSLVKGFGGLASAAENPQQAMKTLSMQATQMAAKPTVAWADFKLMLEQTPAGIAAVAKEMGMTTSELVSNVQDGKIATDKFFDAISKVGTNKAFSELATEAKTVGQAMDGLKETLGNKLTPAFEVLNKKGISIINKLADKIGGINAEGLANKVSKMVDKCGQYLTALKEAFDGVGTEVWSAIKSIGSALGSVMSVEGFKSQMEAVANVIKSVAGFCEKHSGAIAQLIKWLPAIVLGIKGFKIASAVAPGVMAFTKGVAGLAAKGIGGIASKLFGISKSQETVGTTSATSGAQMLTAAKSYALMGVAVLAIAAGFALLAFSAISLANAGGGAIAVMAGLVVALVALGIGMAVLLKTLAPMGAQMMPVATAMLAMGAAVLLVSAGFAILAIASIALANAGGPAIAVMVGMLAAIALLAIGAAALAPALTAGAVGLIAFGAAMIMLGVAAVLVATALVIISTALPTIAQYGASAAGAIALLGAGMIVFAAGATLAGAACVVLAAGLVLVAAGLLIVAAALLVASAGVLVLSAGSALLATTLTLVITPLTIVTALLPVTAAVTLLVAAAFTTLIAMSTVLAATLLLVNASLVLISATALIASAGIIAFGAAMMIGVAGTLLMAAGLKAISSQMKTIASNAKSAESSLTSMRKSVKVVESGLSALGSKAKSAMKKLIGAFDDTASKAESSGKKVGTGFTKGMLSGLVLAPAAAMTMTTLVNSVLSAGASGAYAAGAFISQGFANGMLSKLDVIRSAAEQMAAAADEAVRAKAKISSPSKVADKLGSWWGKGYGIGLLSMYDFVSDAAEKLVSIPSVATPDLAMAYSGELSAEYDYYRNSEYKIVVPLSVDGREFAKAEATYMQDELDRRQTRNNRKQGII